MKTIRVIGWAKGFDKVAMNQLLRAEFGRTLTLAKKEVTAILGNHVVVLSCDDNKVPQVSETLKSINAIFLID
jgi:predicted Rossmann fold nucleotide-binding protein DprA/Smf involved in DNA uptake